MAKKNILGKPKNMSLYISRDDPDKINIDCSVNMQSLESQIQLSLFIDGSVVSTTQNSTRATATVYKYYLEHHNNISVKCFLNLPDVGFSSNVQKYFYYNYTSPVAKPYIGCSSRISDFLNASLLLVSLFLINKFLE